MSPSAYSSESSSLLSSSDIIITRMSFDSNSICLFVVAFAGSVNLAAKVPCEVIEEIILVLYQNF